MQTIFSKKIAIVHDSFTYFGGAERVLFNLIEIFPKADIYTSLISQDSLVSLKQRTKGLINYSKLSNFSWVVNHPDFFKPYILLYWQKLNLDKYDLVISSSHSYCSNWVNVKGRHVSYVYTPPRYLYGEYNEMTFVKRFPFREFLKLPFDYIRKTDYKKIQKIDKIIAISKTIQKRITKYYDRDSVVVYPPVHIKNIFPRKTIKKEYYLFFSRLVKQKGGELVIKAFNDSGKGLLIVGEGKELGNLKKIANNNIKFLKFQPDSKLSAIFLKTKALIYCSIEEDFGIVPVEAMSHGIPVIAYKSGGVTETVIQNKTGLFFDEYNTKSLNASIVKFEKMKFYEQNCIKQSKKFNKTVFKKNIIRVLNTLLFN